MQEVILVCFHNRHVMWISIYSNVPDYVVGMFPAWARKKKNRPQVFFFQAETPLIICKESTLVAIISKSKEQCHSKARSCPFGAIPPKIAEAWVKKAEVLKAQLEYATAVCALLLSVHITRSCIKTCSCIFWNVVCLALWCSLMW